MSDEQGIPERHRTKRTYTLSKAALAARKANAQKSTGPKTEEGKAHSRKNSWKNGLYAQDFIIGKLGKPCQTTCKQYPCSIVEDGGTEPGGNCLDKQYFAEAFDAVITSLQDQEHTGFKSLMAMEMTAALDIIRQAREQIAEEGVVIKTDKIDKDGNSIGIEYKPHPAWAIYNKMLSDMGLSFPELLMTPRSIAKVKTDDKEKEIETPSSIFTRVAKFVSGKE